MAHADHCADLNGLLRSHIATTYGVTNDAILNSCSYFHILDGLVPDIMHDILEGTLPLTTKLLLNHLIVDEQLFTLSTLNDRMAVFKYGPSTVTNKPSPISDTTLTSNDTKVKQSGTSTYTVVSLSFSYSNVVSRSIFTRDGWRPGIQS